MAVASSIFFTYQALLTDQFTIRIVKTKRGLCLELCRPGYCTSSNKPYVVQLTPKELSDAGHLLFTYATERPLNSNIIKEMYTMFFV